jgi:hypothetical protein
MNTKPEKGIPFLMLSILEKSRNYSQQRPHGEIVTGHISTEGTKGRCERIRIGQ